MGKGLRQQERAGFTCSFSFWPWKWSLGGESGSSCAQGQAVGLQALVNQNGVRVMSEWSSITPVLAATGMRTRMLNWLGLHPGGALLFAAMSTTWKAVRGFGGARGRDSQTNSKLAKQTAAKVKQSCPVLVKLSKYCVKSAASRWCLP